MPDEECGPSPRPPPSRSGLTSDPTKDLVSPQVTTSLPRSPGTRGRSLTPSTRKGSLDSLIPGPIRIHFRTGWQLSTRQITRVGFDTFCNCFSIYVIDNLYGRHPCTVFSTVFGFLGANDVHHSKTKIVAASNCSNDSNLTSDLVKILDECCQLIILNTCLTFR